MSYAFRCDRCKKYYLYNTVEYEKGYVYAGFEYRIENTNSGSITTSEEKIDLCDGCLRKLLNFMNNKEE